MCRCIEVVFLLQKKNKYSKKGIGNAEHVFYNSISNTKKKTSPQTVRQHHRTGLIHKRAETLIDIITHLSSDIKRFC